MDYTILDSFFFSIHSQYAINPCNRYSKNKTSDKTGQFIDFNEWIPLNQGVLQLLSRISASVSLQDPLMSNLEQNP